ncbi:unnamed protein product [Gongylonema pulchrum]|uniref:BLLF2 n=1 Tax=Gongylonema pulchrum TaxID=637853 RepID=A0A183E3L0_9BILA|nr:unnamed protein product [Gongylonema pulchrum]
MKVPRLLMRNLQLNPEEPPIKQLLLQQPEPEQPTPPQQVQFRKPETKEKPRTPTPQASPKCLETDIDFTAHAQLLAVFHLPLTSILYYNL